MASVSKICRKDKQNQQGESPIYIRLTHNRKVKYLATKIYVLPEKHWDERNRQVKKSYPESVWTNNFLQSLENKVFNVALQLNNQTLKWKDVDLKGLISGKESKDFFAFGDELVDQLGDKQQYGTQKRYKSVLSKLKSYHKSPTLPFDEITVSYLVKYDAHLAKLGNVTNTIHGNFRVIRTILYKAIDQKLLPREDNPFADFKLKSGKASRVRPSADDIHKLETLDRSKLTQGMIHTLDAFLLALYCAGIRVGDFLQLTPRNIEGNILSYTMGKTKTPRIIAIVGKAQSILDRYNLTKMDEPIIPILEGSHLRSDLLTRKRKISSANAIMNKNLKKIAKLAEIDKPLSMHMARHGWSEMARKKDVDLYKISKALGHKSIAVTEQYLNSFDVDSMEETMKTVFE